MRDEDDREIDRLRQHYVDQNAINAIRDDAERRLDIRAEEIAQLKRERDEARLERERMRAGKAVLVRALAWVARTCSCTCSKEMSRFMRRSDEAMSLVRAEDLVVAGIYRPERDGRGSCGEGEK